MQEIFGKNASVLCYLQKDEALPKAGSYVLVFGEVSPFLQATNPGEFDAAAYYRRKDCLFALRKTKITAQTKNYGRLEEFLSQLRYESDALFWKLLVAERLGVVNKYYADIERGTCGMSVETLINLSRLYGVSLDTLIYGEKEKKSAVSQEEQLMRGLNGMPQVVQDYCLRMLWLFADGLRAAQEEAAAEYETGPETVKSNSDSEKNSGSEA